MDAALKQRLIGAAVLVALAVIFLPMLVDGPEPQQGTSSVPLDIPAAPERNFETRELPVAPTTPVPAATMPTNDDPNRVVTVEAENGKPPEAMPEDLAPTTTATVRGEPVEPPATGPADSGTGSTGPPRMDAAPAPGGRYVVNLGSYANVANANALVAAMKAKGLAAYGDSVPVNGKPGLRVRVGPFAQRGEAEAARLAVTKLRSDVPAAVVALDDAESTAAPEAVRTPTAGGFAVQLGALKSEADANALRDKARAAGFTAFVARADTEAGPLFRVRVGPEIQRANADALKAQIKQKLAIDGVVVSHP